MPTCKTSGCERYTTHCLYCERHRCTADNTCQNPRQRQSDVCADHTICTKPGCYVPRWFNNNPRAANTFCGAHFWYCRVADCFNSQKTAPNSDDDPPNYCETHSCRTSECYASPHRGFTFCKIHLCAIKNCEGAGASHSDGYHYCEDHTCKVYNCANNKSSRGGDACRQHRCAVENCDEIGADTAEGRSWCEKHACELPGCVNPSRHAQNPAKLSPFCTEHDCRAPGCVQARDLDAGRSYCYAHDLCGKTDCEKIKHPSERFCEDHSDTCSRLYCITRRKWHQKEYWAVYDRGLFRSNGIYSYMADSEPAEYCPNHTCRGCFAGRESGRDYCADHDVCAKKDCSGVTSRGVSYCSQHESSCDVKDCFNWRIGEHQPYCSSHGCAAPACNQPCGKHSMYCESYHTGCEAPGCKAPCEPPNRACGDAHRCRRLDCVGAISSNEVDYCLQDICKVERCTNARMSAFDRRVSHDFCTNHESMAHRSRANRALPSSSVDQFHHALLLLSKKKQKKHKSRKTLTDGNSGGTGFVIGEVTDEPAATNGYPGDGDGPDGASNHYVEAGPSDEGGNDQDYAAHGDYAAANYAPYAEQDGANDIAQYQPRYSEAQDTLAQHFDPETLADAQIDAENFQGYVVPGEEYTVVCGVFRNNPSSGQGQLQGEEQNTVAASGEYDNDIYGA